MSRLLSDDVAATLSTLKSGTYMADPIIRLTFFTSEKYAARSDSALYLRVWGLSV